MNWKMPDLGEGVQEGEIVKWLVKEGEKVSMDQHLVEIMTDKATMEIPAPLEGVVQKIVKREGAIAKIGETLAVIGEEGARDQEEEARSKKQEAREEKQKKTESTPTHQHIRTSAQNPLASPAIRQMARDLGVDLHAVAGTGPGGRILKQDLDQRPKKTIHDSRFTNDEKRIPLRGLRRKIAEHMVLSRKTAAHFTHVDQADFTELVALRESTKKSSEAKGIKLTYLPYIIKAVLEGLKKYPTLNASLDDQTHEIIIKKYFNIGVAVATEEGLMVPVVKNADKLGLFDLAREISRVSEAARMHKISLEDLKGGTFTLTNIGSIGGVFSAPIVNVPEVAIMGLHQIKPTPVVWNGQVAIRQMMYISISADHRVVDGAEVAAFLKYVIEKIEKPGEMTL